MAKQPVSALSYAASLLSKKEYTKKQLTTKLTSKKYPHQEIEQALEVLISKSLQSDRRFSEMFIIGKVRVGNGYNYILNKLKENGVEPQLAQEVLNQQEVDWSQICLNYYKKYLRSNSYKVPETESSFQEFLKFENKAKVHLQSKGFRSQEISSAISQIQLRDPDWQQQLDY